MAPSPTSRLRAWVFNFFPAYFGTGARVTSISSDWRDVRIKLPLTWRTRNYVGTIYGGSLYAAVDPFYMIMLIKNLGSEYIVWDKAASIRFKKPGRTTLYARFALDDTELNAIRAALEHERAIDRVYQVDLTDASGVVHATVEKIIYIRRADAVASPAGSAPRLAGRSSE
jgi:acyl-coenzyme A thioesterase PaaI-like protein